MIIILITPLSGWVDDLRKERMTEVKDQHDKKSIVNVCTFAPSESNLCVFEDDVLHYDISDSNIYFYNSKIKKKKGLVIVCKCFSPFNLYLVINFKTIDCLNHYSSKNHYPRNLTDNYHSVLHNNLCSHCR